jgi:hypothetical protein
MGFDITDVWHIEECIEGNGKTPLTPEQIAEGKAMIAEWKRIKTLDDEGDERWEALDALNRRFWSWLGPPGTVFDADTGLPIRTKAALEAGFAQILARDIED